MEQLCKIRELQRAVSQFEQNFERLHGISLNEGMVLCTLSKGDKLTAGEVGELLGITPSNTSKVLRNVETKGLVERVMGVDDKRCMFFSLTASGKSLLSIIKCWELDIPDTLTEAIETIKLD